MESPVTLRLDPELRRSIARIAKRKRCTTSAAMREALTTWVEREEKALSPFELCKDLIGSGETDGDPRLSENTGRRVREMLLARQAKRDAG